MARPDLTAGISRADAQATCSDRKFVRNVPRLDRIAKKTELPTGVAQDAMNQSDWASENRSARNWTRREQVGRVLWWLVQPAFRLSPRPFWAWRRALLRLFGARIGKEVHVYPTTRVSIPWNIAIGDRSSVGDRAILYALGKITLGSRTTVSQGAHICAGTHDIRSRDFTLLKPPITIGDDTWVCADAFVGPGVVVGNNCILGARAVVMKKVPDGLVMAGNPARVLGRRERNDTDGSLD